MDSYGIYAIVGSLAGMLALLLLNGLVVASEFALIKLRFSHFNKELLEEMMEDKRFAPILDEPDRTLRTLRLVMLLCIIGYAFILLPFARAGAAEAAAITPLLAWPVYICAFVVAAGVAYACSDLVPRGLGLREPVKILRRTSLAVRALMVITRPMRLLFAPLAKAMRTINRIEVGELGEMISLDLDTQLENLRQEVPGISQKVAYILRNTIELGDLNVQHALCPRQMVVYLDTQKPAAENLEVAKSSGHTRYPLCNGDLDDCIGLIHIKDIFRETGKQGEANLDLSKIKRNIQRISHQERLDSALDKLMKMRAHMALVQDEFGGTVGVLTLESILERLVGDIRDEFDANEEKLFRKINDDTYWFSGMASMRDLEDHLGVEVEEGDYSTLSGLVNAELGRIPNVDERIEIDRLVIVAKEVEETRMLGAEVTVLPDPEDEE